MIKKTIYQKHKGKFTLFGQIPIDYYIYPMETITVYKYHKFNMHLMELIINNTFHFANWDELNDPFESDFMPSDEFITDLLNGKHKRIPDPERLWNIFSSNKFELQLSSEFYSTTESRVKYLFDFLPSLIEFTTLIKKEYDIKVLSFCGDITKEDKHKQLLMWSHYAGYNGVRLKFELPVKFNKKYLNEKTSLKKVEYSTAIPIINKEEDIEKAMYNKLKSWEYEDEYRIIKSYNNKLRFNKKRLTEIVCGNKLNRSQLDCLFKIVQLHGHKHVNIATLFISPMGFSTSGINPKYMYNISKGRFPNVPDIIK